MAGVVVKGKKRKRGDDHGIEGRGHDQVGAGEAEQEARHGTIDERITAPQKAAVTASTGFVHLLPPTPEIWTSSLPHRTQVVYTPDYSYILHRLRARPGSVLIEAGSGSGSFTHAAARAVFNGYFDNPSRGGKGRGKVWSYEFHEQRMQKLRQEITDHGLDGIVEITHKDVCQDGFSVDNDTVSSNLCANAIFLDLPAPWLALKHLTRSSMSGTTPSQLDDVNTSPSNSVLDPTSSVYLCTFSPCIEQVQRTISTLRKMGWLDIETVELSCKRLETRRERVGLQEEGLRGVNSSPATVDEAVERLRDFESRSRIFHNDEEGSPDSASATAQLSKQQRLSNIRDALEGRKLYKEGRLVHRAEQELKMHTSYLVFAILPREWSLEDELRAQEKWPGKVAQAECRDGAPMSKRQMKRAAKAKAGGNKAFEMEIEMTQKERVDESIAHMDI